MKNFFALILPGILMAATGVGSGDLVTASLAGLHVGTGLLWAALLGAFLKWTLNEGLTRWQMSNQSTFFQAMVQYLPKTMLFFFLPYLLLWTFSVGSALVKACGIGADSIYPLASDTKVSQTLWGIIHLLVAFPLTKQSKNRPFEVIMAICIALMFASVLFTTFPFIDHWASIIKDLVLPDLTKQDWKWSTAIIGSVGGTVTILSYSYWIKDKGRQGYRGLITSRWDLAFAYLLTALFSMAMIIVGTKLRIPADQLNEAKFSYLLSQQFRQSLGSFSQGLFLIGFWAAVFSSLLGVLQSIPFLFAEFYYGHRLFKKARPQDLQTTPAYQCYLLFFGICSLGGLFCELKFIQLLYSILGAFFMPFLALTMLIINNNPLLIKKPFKNNWVINLILVFILLLFFFLGIQQVFSSEVIS